MPPSVYGRAVSDVEEVLRAATRRATALADGDAAALRSLLHPDLRWTTFRGDVLDRDGYVAGNTGTGLRWLGQRLVEPDVVVHGDTAVLTAVVLDDVDGGHGRERFRLRLTQTWVRDDGGWVCLSGHAGPRLDEPADGRTTAASARTGASRGSG